MAKRTNPKLIGAFVMGGIILAMVGILAFAGGKFFVTTTKGVLYFEGSLGGLAVGAPVNFRGVQIGTVTAITIEYDAVKQEIHIPVEIEVEPEKIVITNGERSGHNIQVLVERGLRAQLQVQSLVTGQASINLDFHPDTPIRLVSTRKDELPTVPSAMESLQADLASVLNKLSAMPLDQIVENANGAINDLRGTLTSMGQLATRVNGAAGPILDEVRAASEKLDVLVATANTRLQLQPGEPLQTFNDTMLHYGALAQDLRGQVAPVSKDLRATLQNADDVMTQLDSITSRMEREYGKNPALLTQVSDTLRDARAMLGAIRSLAEYLQRNPNALLTGKQ